jgi:sigma-B regulation protein RsbU (phosphoserine phosphatase)
LDEHHLGMYVLDVTGHGVGAALLSASIQRWLSPVPEHSCLFERNPQAESGFQIASPASVATTLNGWFQAEPKGGKFFTLIYGILDLRDGEFRYTTAGHPPPLKLGADGAEVCPLAHGVPIGMLKEFDFGEARLRLEKGDRLLLYTDGAPEAEAADEELYEMDRLVKDMESQRDCSPEETLESIMENLRAWCGSETMEDDVTFLMVDVTGVEHPEA